ncbi:MAG: GGDEF domain-containing protein [Planctomycetota bacterium]
MNPASAHSANGHASPLGRVIVAGGGALAAKVAGVVGGSATVVAVPGALAALAEAAKPPAERGSSQNGHPPPRDRVVLAGTCLEGIEATTLGTLRELGVGDRVLLVDLPNAGALRDSAGPLREVRGDADDETWEAALAMRGSGPALSESAPDAGVVEKDLLDVPGAPESIRLAPRGGDTELVQAILDIGAEGGRRAPRIALGIARERSGIDGLGFVVHQRGDVPTDHASAIVSFRGETYGHLHAHPRQNGPEPRAALADRLQPWADWLARWIALDQQARRLRDMAMRDELTGVWNRRYFDRFLGRLIERAGDDRRQVTLMVFDIDDFKKYNDAHGHAAGDEILKAAAELMQSVVRDHDVVARIGGDEFAVIFWDAERPREEGSSHPDDVANIAKRFQAAVYDLRFPALARTDMDTLTISGGLAGFPWDGRTPAELLHHADLMALESKRKGKNALTFGAGALRCDLDEH